MVVCCNVLKTSWLLLIYFVLGALFLFQMKWTICIVCGIKSIGGKKTLEPSYFCRMYWRNYVGFFSLRLPNTWSSCCCYFCCWLTAAFHTSPCQGPGRRGINVKEMWKNRQFWEGCIWYWRTNLLRQAQILQEFIFRLPYWLESAW